MRFAESTTDFGDQHNAANARHGALQSEGRRRSRLTAEVRQGVPADSEENERQCRKAIIDYFAILREWDLKLRLNESEKTAEPDRP